MSFADSTLAVDFDAVRDAALRIEPFVRRTPVTTSRTLDERTGAKVFLKCENLQRTGSFKFRGAVNALLSLSPDDHARGVMTYSSGNHAQALARAGRLLGVDVTVVMPDNAPAVKRAATEAYGAEIVSYDPEQESREVLGRRIARERGLTLVPPYDHPAIMAGQGTAALELFEDVGALDVLAVCCGGGGLLSGSAVSAAARAPACRVYGVEPEAGDDGRRSLHAGAIQTVHNPDTIADGARTPFLGDLTFPVIQRYVRDIVTVPDDALVRTMHFCFERLKLVVEPTGVLAAAAVLEGAIEEIAGARVGVIVSGGNVDIARACRLFATTL